MNQTVKVLALSTGTTAALVTLVAGMIGGCGSQWYIPPAEWMCDDPIDGRTDKYGNNDPCCSYEACCPNPNPDHVAADISQPPGSKLTRPDPCCKTDACPGWDPWKPIPDAGAPCDSGTGGGDAGADGGAKACNDTCDGECVPRAPAGFTEPMLVWIGPVGQEPPCPEAAPHETYHGYADLDAPPLTCPECTCDAPEGTCELPGKITASSAICTAPSTAHLDFDPPASWDGACTNQDAIPADAKCNGGPCAQSLAIEPLKLTEQPCTPHPLVPKLHARDKPPQSAFKTAAVACQAENLPSCAGGVGACLPSSASPPAFESCILGIGEVECPESYPDRRLFYSDFTDTRRCSDCTCDPPEGGNCTSFLTVYQDSACKGSLVVGISLDARELPFCADIPGNLALGSKAASAPTYVPGSCAAHGGEASGEVATIEPATLCCRQN